jgi:hypothetical protein
VLRCVWQERHLPSALERCGHFTLMLRAGARLASWLDLGAI